MENTSLVACRGPELKQIYSYIEKLPEHLLQLYEGNSRPSHTGRHVFDPRIIDVILVYLLEHSGPRLTNVYSKPGRLFCTSSRRDYDKYFAPSEEKKRTTRGAHVKPKWTRTIITRGRTKGRSIN